MLAGTGFAKSATMAVRGIASERIISQGCPNLANVISLDREVALACKLGRFPMSSSKSRPP